MRRVKKSVQKIVFTFKLNPYQAQDIYGMFMCAWEDDSIRQLWNHPRKAGMRNAIRRFERQLEREYRRTGVEVI